jgi:large subunit ribosomal protein L17
MVTEFLENERMVTTVPKAKEVRSVAEKMITLGKRETLHARRQALSFLRKKSVVFKLFDSLAPRFTDRHGGYTRILRLGARPGDGAEVAVLEFVDAEAVAEDKKATTQKKGKKKTKAKAKDSADTKEKGKSTKAKARTKKTKE